jgi:hypothetical protein
MSSSRHDLSEPAIGENTPLLQESTPDDIVEDTDQRNDDHQESRVQPTPAPRNYRVFRIALIVNLTLAILVLVLTVVAYALLIYGSREFGSWFYYWEIIGNWIPFMV